MTSSPRRGGYYLDESLGLGDLNNDGQSEFFTYSAPIDSSVPGRFTIFQRRSTFGSDVSDFFTKTVIENPNFIPSGASIYSYVVDDFNHDGLNDLACSLNDARLEVLTGAGNFQFRDATFYVTNGPLIEGGDFNGDGVTDIASMWASGLTSFSVRPFASVLYGRTDGSF
ncbi:MAG: VCBS repeat-containing protein [Pirellulales bacterium]